MLYQITKNEKQTIRNKTDKNWKKDLEQRVALGVKTLHIILGHKKWKWQIKCSEKNQAVLFVGQISQSF